MESHLKPFHLETPFQHYSKHGNFKRPTRSMGYTSSIKSSSHTDGTFDDVIEYNKHLIALKDLAKVKEQYYDDYIENLERKVLHQRKKLAKSEAPASIKSKSRKPNKKKLPKLQHHKLKHDAEYMQKVSKSKYYHLLAARDSMIQKDLIKSKNDEDQFWRQALNDSDLWSRPLPDDVPSDIMCRLMVDRFSSRRPPIKSILKKNRTVTFNESPTRSSDIVVSDKVKDPNLLRFKVKLDLPKMHSMKKMAPLPPIEPDINSLSESTDKIRRMRNLRRVQHAYDVAMINHAAAHQMLESHGLSSDNPSSFLTRNALPITSSNSKQSSKSGKSKTKSTPSKSRGKDKQVFITEPVYGHDEVLIPDLEYKYPDQKHRTKKKTKQEQLSSSSNSQQSQGGESQNDIDKKPNVDVVNKVTPLDYGMMMAQNDVEVKNATCLSSFWVNYITTSK